MKRKIVKSVRQTRPEKQHEWPIVNLNTKVSQAFPKTFVPSNFSGNAAEKRRNEYLNKELLSTPYDRRGMCRAHKTKRLNTLETLAHIYQTLTPNQRKNKTVRDILPLFE